MYNIVKWIFIIIILYAIILSVVMYTNAPYGLIVLYPVLFVYSLIYNTPVVSEQKMVN